MYSFLSSTYQVMRTMCSGLALACASTSMMLCSACRTCAEKLPLTTLPCASDPIMPLTKMVRPLAATPWEKPLGRDQFLGCKISMFSLLSRGKRFQDAAGNNHLLHFGCAFVNSQRTNFAVEALHRLSADYAQAAEDLHGRVDYLLRSFGGSHFGHGCFHRDRPSQVAQPGRAVREQGSGINTGGHRSQLRLGQLKIGEYLAEHFSRGGAPQGLMQGAARKAQRGGSH